MKSVWTVILENAGRVIHTLEVASQDPDTAKKTIESRHAGSKVIALILGRHETHTYDRLSAEDGKGYEIYQHGANEPTGGSD